MKYSYRKKSYKLQHKLKIFLAILLAALISTTGYIISNNTFSKKDNYINYFNEKTEDGINVVVDAKPNSIPKNSILHIEKVKDENEKVIKDSINEVKGDKVNITKSYTYDICILDKNGNEIEPNDNVRISFQSNEISNSNLDTKIYHTTTDEDNTIEKTEKLKGRINKDVITATTDSFSYYTVAFTYNDKTYNLGGDEEVKLEKILNVLELTGKVTNVESSNNELFYPELREDGYYIVSIAPFETEEYLNVTIDNIVYKIEVTDATKTINFTFMESTTGTSFRGTITYTYTTSETDTSYTMTFTKVVYNNTSGKSQSFEDGSYLDSRIYVTLFGTKVVNGLTTTVASGATKTLWSGTKTQTWTKTHDYQSKDFEDVAKVDGGMSYAYFGSVSVSPKTSYTISYNGNGGTVSPTSDTKWYGEPLTLPTTGMSKSGYTFNGWYTAASGGTKYGTTYTANSGTTIYAQWTAKSYTLTWNLAGGKKGTDSGPINYTVTYGEQTSNARDLPIKTGYVCTGMYDSSNNKVFDENGHCTTNGGYWTATYANGGRWKYDGSLTVTAKYTANTYTIGYTLNGGTKGTNGPTSGTYDQDVQISNPTKTVTVTGNANSTGATVGSATSKAQTFSGWTSTTLGSNAKTGTAANPTTAWTGSSTKNTYFRNLRESGTATMVANWTPVAVTLPTLSKTGYTCKWYTDATAGSLMGAGGASWTPGANSAAAVTAYARCTENTATLTYANGGHGTAPSNVTMKYSAATNAASAISATGYNFTGWKRSDTGAVIAAGAQVKAANVNPTALTLTAQWSEKTATLTYNNGGHGTAPANATMKYTTATNAASAISAAGYAFAGWKRSDTGAVIAAGAQVKAANVEPTALTLTAQWTPYKLTLKYHVNGGTITTDTSQATRWRANSSLVQRSTDSGATWADITAVINTDTTTADLWNVGTYNAKKTGYSISGTKAYNTKADGTGVNINQDHNASSSPDNAPTVARINGGALTADKTMNIYVNWVPNTYTIGYTLNGGTKGTNGPTSGTYDTDVQISNPTKTVTVTGNANSTGATVGNATSKAQTFSGWTSTTLGSNAKTGTAANPTTAWTGSSTKNTYFRNLRESGTATMVANWTPVAVTLPTLSKTGYTCKWYTDATAGSLMGAGGASWTPGANSAAAVTAYARCTANTYTIGYTLNGGTKGTNGPTSGTYDQDVQISNPTKTVTVTGNENSSGATVGNATSKAQTFSGWTSTTLGSNAKTGTAANPTTAWTGSSTKNTYFKNLRESGTVTMVANWTPVAMTLPTATKTGYTCKWYSSSGTSGGNLIGTSGGSYTPSATSAASVTVYARCTNAKLTVTQQVKGSIANTNKEFNYTLNVKNNGTNISGTYAYTGTKSGNLTFTNGNATFKLKHGQNIEITFPSDYTYTITQVNDGYTVSKTNDSGTLSEDKTASFTNTLEGTTPTGIFTDIFPYVLLLLSGVGVIIWIKRFKHI